MSFTSLCATHTITVSRPLNTKDSSGGVSQAYTPLPSATSIACTIQDVSLRELAVFAQRNVKISHYIFVETNPFAQRGDVVTATPVRGSLTPVTFIVVGTQDMGGRGRYFCIEAYEYVG